MKNINIEDLNALINKLIRAQRYCYLNDKHILFENTLIMLENCLDNALKHTDFEVDE